jgi:hypothetical protein
VFTVTVVDAEAEDAITRLPLEALHDENANGPDGDVDIETATPLSNQPSPVGEVR